MSEARTLKEKLEEVQRALRQVREEMNAQRARHAREVAALQRILEDTRREADRLRKRIEAAEQRNPAF